MQILSCVADRYIVTNEIHIQQIKMILKNKLCTKRKCALQNVAGGYGVRKRMIIIIK